MFPSILVLACSAPSAAARQRRIDRKAEQQAADRQQARKARALFCLYHGLYPPRRLVNRIFSSWPLPLKKLILVGVFSPLG